MALAASFIVLSDVSDAQDQTYSLSFETGQEVDEDLTALTGRGLLFLYRGSLPDGLGIVADRTGHEWYGDVYRTCLRGTVQAAPGIHSFILSDDTSFFTFSILVAQGECTVTYDAGIGLVNGKQVWSETLVKGSYASLPAAVHSSGAYSFAGWAASPTASEPLVSYTALGDATLHAVWKRNTVQISDAAATVATGQTASLPMRTVPEDAVLSVGSHDGLPGGSVSVYGHGIKLDMSGVAPGTYFVTLTASSTGYISGVSVVTVRVPISIVEPIEYVLSAGDAFSYTPVTEPSNASVTLDSATLDGSPLGGSGGVSVEGRSIKGVLSRAGTYAFTYTASLEGYVPVTDTVYVKVVERPASVPAPVMGTAIASPRPGEPRVFDLVLSGHANASNIIWSHGNDVFATSSPTALYAFPASGAYTLTCTVVGFDGSSVSQDIPILCMDNYHREAAWAGIRYCYIAPPGTDIDIVPGSPFSVTDIGSGSGACRLLSGTPTSSCIGGSYRVTSGTESWTVTVYPSESAAPVADFEIVLSDDGRTVTAVFTGTHASFHVFDFDGDGIPEPGDSFTYPEAGMYTVVCTAVNNVSETSKSDMVSIDVVPRETASLSDLTDFQMLAGERLDIILSLSPGDSVSVSGTASGFCEADGDTIRVSPTERGEYGLTVSIRHSDGTVTERTVNVTVRGTEVQELEETSRGYAVVMAVFFAISVLAVAALLLRDSGRGRPRRLPIMRLMRRRLRCRR
jgi:PKD repeat protein